MWSLLVHLAAVGVGISEHVARELDYHHLHTETNTECRNVVGPGVFDGGNLSFYATLSESRADDHSVHGVDAFGHVVVGESLRIYELQYGLVVVVCSCL